LRRNIVIAVLSTFCVTATLFLTVPESYIGDHSPWLDINDDGKIDMKDIAAVARAYGASGTPMNKTSLLTELQNRIDELSSKLVELQSCFDQKVNEVISLALPHNATFASDTRLVERSPTWKRIPGMSLTLTLNRTSLVIVTLY